MRLDLFLYENGLAKSRSYASELIKKGLVTVGGKVISKPSYDIGENGLCDVAIVRELFSYVGRGGLKLEAALDAFSFDVKGAIAVDIGASTGGFTDCLLKRGASKVYAVDSGHGQLDKSLSEDRRVVNIEGFNARNLDDGTVPEKCNVAVCDVSFISQTYIIPAMCNILTDDARFITLIKPQFECGREALGKGGIVKDEKYYRAAVLNVIRCAEENGLFCIGLIISPIKGGDGNTEFLAMFSRNNSSRLTDEEIKEVTG